MTNLRSAIDVAIDTMLVETGDDSSLVARLVEQGIDEPLAWELAAFVPLAFSAIVFEGLPTDFPKNYQELDPDCEQVRPRPLAAQRVFASALPLARERTQRIPQPTLLPVISRCDLFRAANAALNDGA